MVAAPAAAIIMILGKGCARNGEGEHRRRNGQKSAHVSLSFSASSNSPSSLNAFCICRLRPRRGGDPGHIRGTVAGILRINCGEVRSEEHTSELQSLMRNSYAVF